MDSDIFIYFCNIFTASETSYFLIFLHPLIHHFSLFHIEKKQSNWIIELFKAAAGNVRQPSLSAGLGFQEKDTAQEYFWRYSFRQPSCEVPSGKLWQYSFRKTLAIFFQENFGDILSGKPLFETLTRRSQTILLWGNMMTSGSTLSGKSGNILSEKNCIWDYKKTANNIISGKLLSETTKRLLAIFSPLQWMALECWCCFP